MDELGQVIEQRYKVVKRLGEGAFGITYLAEDRRTIFDNDQQFFERVVVKIAHTSSDELARERLNREAEILASIHSPHVAMFRDVGLLPDKRPFLVVDYVDGSSLEAVLSQHPLPLSDALAVLEAVAQGLEAAHKMSVIHRDVKPSNIIVPQGPGPTGLRYDQAVLVDFGVLGRLEQNTGLTQTGQIFGTPYYMSPEQFHGERQSPAVDVYGLGAVLFAMVFGRPPFSGGDVTRTIVMSLTAEVSIPLTPVIPGEVRSFLLRCLSKDPLNRPKSGFEALQEIRSLRRIVEAGPEPTEPRASESGPVAKESLSTSKQLQEPIQPQSSAIASKAALHNRVMLGAISLIVLCLSVFAWKRWPPVVGILIGLLFAIGGVMLSAAIRKWFAMRKSQIELDAGSVLLGTKSRISLSQSLAIEVDQLILRVRRLDERILAKTLAVMLKEYEAAVESQNRQAALMNIAQLLEKLMTRISPWYIRHEKLIALTVSLIGVLSGAASISVTIVKMVRGQ